jgi:hypothetical protein
LRPLSLQGSSFDRWYLFFLQSFLLLRYITSSISLHALEPLLLILTTFFLIEMYGPPPYLAIRLHIFLERYALSAQSLPSLPMNARSSSTCFESALNGDVTLNERIRRRLLQSTMKCSLRKSILASLLLPPVPYRQPSHVPPGREASAVNGADTTTLLLSLASFFPIVALLDDDERVE